MIVCIAEKPSVGRDIAKILGANRSHDGFMEGNGYIVTWTFGHLCTLLEPHDYTEQWKGWNLNVLPMIPTRFGIKVNDDKGVQKQFATIQKLFAEADEIINCGDAGQEGELIQRWVMQKAGVKCPVKRLWISSLTEEAIKEGFANLKPQDDYQKLYEAGLMRAIGDWLLGMNATRAYTLRYRKENKQVLSLGRVQTPTLALIVKRQLEIENFVPRTYWELKTTYRDTLFSAIIRKSEEDLLDEIEKLKEKQENSKAKTKKPIPTLEELQKENIGMDPIESAEAGEALLASIQNQPFTITKVERKKGTESAPRLFDLTSLQVECNKKFSFSADETLRHIQSLYEKKITTYPRVDTTFLSDDIYPKCGGILRGIEPYFPQIGPLHGKPLLKSKKVFDSSKVTDHHAIIPTGVQPNNLTADEQKVFNLVALRFIAAFYPDCQVANTTIFGEVKAANTECRMPNAEQHTYLFKTTGREVLEPGWRNVFSNKDGGNNTFNDDDDTELPNGVSPQGGTEGGLVSFTKGESGSHLPQVIEKQTTPPKPYTEATLLRAMETAGKTVDNEELRDAMKENGIGRPSTRAAIIQTLFKRNYIVRERKNIKATPIAIDLIRTVHSPLLKSAELTGLWEKKLRMIERGDYTAQQFLDELKQMTTEVINGVKADKSGMRCPVCGQGIIIRGNHAFGCSRWREGCTFREPFNETTIQSN